MDRTTGRTRLVVCAGIGLVTLGAWLLFQRVVGPLAYPLHGILHALGGLARPLSLIVVGVVVLSMGRVENGVGGVFRSRSERVVGGVLGGVATRLDIDAWVVRTVFVVFTVLTGIGTGLLIYVAAMILLPEEPGLSSAAPAPPVPSSATSRS